MEVSAAHCEALLERFWKFAYPDPNTGCWYWGGYLTKDGYGMFKMGGRMELAHRAAYKLFKGDIPPETELDHLCRERSCVNPDHSESVSHTENVRRGWWGRRTHCLHGHEFAGDNLYIHPDGRRVCKICRRQSDRKRSRKKNG